MMHEVKCDHECAWRPRPHADLVSSTSADGAPLTRLAPRVALLTTRSSLMSAPRGATVTRSEATIRRKRLIRYVLRASDAATYVLAYGISAENSHSIMGTI
jgi:hypothetical protein